MVNLYTYVEAQHELKFNARAVNQLAALVSSRIDTEAVFESAQMVQKLVMASGGRVQQLMQMTADACLTADARGHTKIAGSDVDYAIKQAQFGFERVIPEHHYPLMVQVCKTKRVVQNEEGQKMLFNTSVLEYNGDRRWNYINPVVKFIPAYQTALAHDRAPPSLKPDPFLELNQEELARLITFVRFAADERLTIGFISINFANDRQILLQALQQHPRCQNIQFAILDFPDPNLRFLRDAIVAALPSIQRQPDKKLVLVITGLEQSIGMVGDYPPLLQDLNYVRDAFANSVAHPMLICLPDYSLTRLARFAPDFWAWRVATFKFQSLPTTVQLAQNQALQYEPTRLSLDKAEKQERIDLLERLLMEYPPVEQPERSANRNTRVEILNELAVLYRNKGQPQQAEDVLQQALALIPEDDSLISAKSLSFYTLAQLRQTQGAVDEALTLYQQCLQLLERTNDVQGKAATLNNMAQVIAEQRQIEHALQFWQKSLKLYEQINDVRGKAVTLANLGYTLAEQGDFEMGIAYLQEAVAILQNLGFTPQADQVQGLLADVLQQQLS